MAFVKLFPSQQPDEKILLVVREHWFRLAFKIIVILILSLLPTVFKALLVGTDIFSRSGTAQDIAHTVFSVYYLALMVALFVIFVLYYLNLHIVSDERVVDIDQVGLLFHQVSELNVEKIEDVTSQRAGVLGNVFNYGQVYIQTAGTVERFVFDNVPDPEGVASIILELYEKKEKSPREVVVEPTLPPTPQSSPPQSEPANPNI